MLVNWHDRYLFVHVPKTGGTSITQLLKHDCKRAVLPLRAVGYLFDNSGHTLPEFTFPAVGYPYHIRARDLKRLWGAKKYDGLFSFAFVRNPWDVVVSEYFYIQRKWDHPLKNTVRKLGTFADYVHWKRDNNYHRNQYEWLTDDAGQSIVNRIGRFETYEEDANAILAQIGRSETVPHKNATVKKPFKSYYTDETIDLVAQMYQGDIERYGYSSSF